MSVPVEDASVDAILADESASYWLKSALREALQRDPADALNDALTLAGVLDDRLRKDLNLYDEE